MNEISDRILGGTKVKTKYDREVYKSMCIQQAASLDVYFYVKEEYKKAKTISI